MGVADHARRESRRFFSMFIYITSGLSYHLEQKISKNTLPCSVQPFFWKMGVADHARRESRTIVF